MARPRPEPPPPPPAPEPIPLRVLLIFAFILAPMGVPLTVACAIGTWQAAHKVEARGVVVEARVVHDDHPPPRSKGSWVKEWLAEYETADGPRRRWLRVARFSTSQEAKPGRDIGQTLAIWHTPGEDDATTDPPQAVLMAFWTAWSTVIGTAGLASIYALVRRFVMGRWGRVT